MIPLVYLIFGNLISRLVWVLAHLKLPSWLALIVINTFASQYNINLDELEHPVSHYRSLDAFFTRTLDPRYRPIDIDPSHIVSPVDGTVLEFGEIQSSTLIQAKGNVFQLEDLLPDYDVSPFQGGTFATIYLAPYNCHLIFSPMDGDVIATHHEPGLLYPVREPYITSFKNLYTQNERLTSIIQTPKGKVAVVKVGAFNVGTMTLPYNDSFHTNRFNQKRRIETYETPILVKKGEQIGTFHLGSTVILLFEKGMVNAWNIQHKQALLYGEKIAITSN